jgi:hypothetical protein
MRLPSYRTSHLLRFHPYPRVKLSNREIMVSHANLWHLSAIFDTFRYVADLRRPLQQFPGRYCWKQRNDWVRPSHLRA